MADHVDGPDGPEARVAVLEEIARATRETFADIRSELRDIRSELRDMRGELVGIRADLAEVRVDVGYLKGRIEQLPTTWVMLTGILGGQVALAALFLAALRLGGKG